MNQKKLERKMMSYPSNLVGIRQQAFLRVLLREGVWRKDWCIITNSITQKIADSLVKKKLVRTRISATKITEYLLTDAGKSLAKTL